MLLILGAKLELTPGGKGHGRGGGPGAGAAGRDSRLGHAPAVREPGQPLIHRVSTAEEIWNDTDGAVDVVVSGVGTGGTITGVGQVLKARKPSVRMIAVEPEARRCCPAASRARTRSRASAAGFVPAILDRGVIDEIIQVTNEDSFDMARLCARVEGVPVGISSGRGPDRRLRRGGARRDGRQADRRHHPQLRRTLPVDGAVRGAVTPRS